jgi:hypothetical protein
VKKKSNFFFGFGQENFKLLLPNKKSVTVEGTKKGEKLASQAHLHPPPSTLHPLPQREKLTITPSRLTHSLHILIERVSECERYNLCIHIQVRERER